MLYSRILAGGRLATPDAPIRLGMGDQSPPIEAKESRRDELLAIDTPVVDSEGSLVFEVGFADIGPRPASETLKPLVSAILTEAFIGTLGPLATGVCFTTIPAFGLKFPNGGFR